MPEFKKYAIDCVRLRNDHAPLNAALYYFRNRLRKICPLGNIYAIGNITPLPVFCIYYHIKMKKSITLVLACFAALLHAQEPYKNPALTPDQRAKDLLGRMTLDEKISQTLNGSPAIPRFGIPAVDWWNEALHGVARAGKATVFPQTIGLAATFNPAAVQKTYSMISDEARAKHHYFKNNNQFKRYQGLTFWTPNINIFRDPRWGRGQETYGEDPFLTTQMGKAVVFGLQGDSTGKYDKVHACAKHYAVHSGPEWNRHSFDTKKISDRNLWETYLPAFKALVTEAGVKEVMCAYNRYDGEPCCSSKELLVQILRKQWKFDDVIVSDCGAIDDFFRPKAHLTHQSAVEASADAVISGTDLVCGQTYKSLSEAVKKGLITEAQIDVSVFRLLRARFELGMFDHDSLVSWAKIPYAVVESPEHVAQSLQMARESIVLLKNKGNVLPLKKDATIAVVGPNAADSLMLLGNYNGTPSKSVTILEGIANSAAKKIIYEKGCDFVGDSLFVSRMPACMFEGKPGFRISFWNTANYTGETAATLQAAGPLRFDAGGNTVFAPGVNLTNFSGRFQTVYMPAETGTVIFKLTADDGFRLVLNGNEVLKYERAGSLKDQQYKLPVVKGIPVEILLEYYQLEGNAVLKFDLGFIEKVNVAAVADRVKTAGAIVFVGGMSAALEGEEMNVDLPGFKRGDRTKIELPDVQLEMLKALKATGKPVILVLCSGSSVALPWESANLDAILEAWYPGQQGGKAVADVLFGDYNPAGKLPLTFYSATSDLPDFEDYEFTNGRTYRYFKGRPLYPFGYGLSYTSFAFQKPVVKKAVIPVGGSTALDVVVKNTGSRAGEEVVQVYITNKQDAEGPVRSLRAFKKVNIPAGKALPVHIELPNKAFEFFNPNTNRLEVVPGKYTVYCGNSSDATQLQAITVTIQ